MKELSYDTIHRLLSGAKEEKEKELIKLHEEWGEILTSKQQKRIQNLESDIEELKENIEKLEKMLHKEEARPRRRHQRHPKNLEL